MTRILVVEDEPKISGVVADYLAHAGFQVCIAATAAAAMQTWRASEPDLIVLDLGLPDRDGLEVAREIRRSSAVPIIVLTARAEEHDRIVGLELGADDYVAKPFSPGELVARIRAVLRRGDAVAVVDRVARVGGLAVDPLRRTVSIEGRSIELTPTEFDLLLALVRSPGQVLTRRQLLRAVTSADGDESDRAVDAHVKNLRRKIEPDPHHPVLVLTVHGVGYRSATA